MTTVTSNRDEEERLLTPSEVAKLFRVDPKTVTRWAKSGKLSYSDPGRPQPLPGL